MRHFIHRERVFEQHIAICKINLYYKRVGIYVVYTCMYAVDELNQVLQDTRTFGLCGGGARVERLNMCVWCIRACCRFTVALFFCWVFDDTIRDIQIKKYNYYSNENEY